MAQAFGLKEGEQRMHVATRVAAAVVALSAWFLVVPAGAQTLVAPVPGVAQGPKLGEMEVKAYQKIPRVKVAVQLTSDSHLSRELRRQVMIRLSQRGNEVGFSGGNVMRMDVSYFDLSGGYDRNAGTIGGQPDYAPTGSNPRPALPGNTLSRRDGLSSPTRCALSPWVAQAPVAAHSTWPLSLA